VAARRRAEGVATAVSSPPAPLVQRQYSCQRRGRRAGESPQQTLLHRLLPTRAPRPGGRLPVRLFQSLLLLLLLLLLSPLVTLVLEEEKEGEEEEEELPLPSALVDAA
ncbi:unnamed protein product, partial [Ectocarpus sp. 6 AP-2014]